ncbi:glycosyltransferase family 2 protein [Leptolyngbya sp. NIES-2104]|uniref:glycosyltransferase family 2 protein n=1 Tax=Leptolyngbya sp. NIES-2104 TaxID=1552121 RepID=UPI0006ECCD6E|nr:glycosyltransferase [Leptolyngbya sp. NIES-2104]GAP95432.1 dolichol-phosphate mannosyltransferase in lipid-linked oligosaccharide synthesis cluster [Leptolyngbya sp. NIES-2104]
MFILNAALVGLVGVLLGWSIWTGLETIFALSSKVSSQLGIRGKERVVVLIPAHNEEAGLENTLIDVMPQLRSQDRLVVVADNCTDQTAEIARKQGAIVIERQDLIQRGKGYALDYGLRSLLSEPPDVVIVIDADCRVEPGAIATLTETVLKQKRPAQATYLMQKPAEATAKDSVSAFAFTTKNLVRPLGLWRLGLPCLLTGTGMAFPWAAIQAVDFASGHLVEDMKLSVDLTIAGYAPVYCPEARVIGTLPQQDSATQSQRTRWEHGHLQAIAVYVPVLLKAAIEKWNVAAIVLAIELSVPPLSLLVMSWIGVSTIAIVWGVFTGFWPAGICAIVAGMFLLMTVFGAWAKFGREDLPLRELLAIPFYILWKIPVYLQFLVRPQRDWIRTARD